MANLEYTIQQLRNEREQRQLQLEKLNSAISVLEGLSSNTRAISSRNGVRPKRAVSALARSRMARAQKARWARVRAGKKGMSRPALSVAARRKIAAAQRARWARVKAQAFKKAA
jgi:hypothetical protein